MSATTRQVTWGHALLASTVTYPGGLHNAVERIRGTLGPQIGTRNSFAKLYKLDPIDMKPSDKWRAWLLLTSIEQSPEDWGIGSDVIPAIHADRVGTLERFLVHPPGLEPGTQ